MFNTDHIIYDLTFIIIVFFLSLFWFQYLWNNVQTDIRSHASIIKEIHDGIRPYPANFLYYLTVNAVSGFNTANLAFASILILSLSVLLKFLVTKGIINEILPSRNKKGITINLIAFALLFVTSLPSIPFIFSNYLYVGTYPANVWHNSTTIFLMPFALLLFWQSYKLTKDYKFNRLVYIFFLVILNILIKPSFIFVFIVVYPVILFSTHKFSKPFWINIIPLVLAAIFILIEFFFIYKTNNSSNANGIAIKPFFLLKYRLESENWLYIILIFFLSLITSYLFPIIYLLRNPSEKREPLIVYVLLCASVAILIRHLLCETGPREHAGNFAWQVIVCSYLVFLVFTSKLFSRLINSHWNFNKYKFEFIAFSLHLFIGFVYILEIAFLKSYM